MRISESILTSEYVGRSGQAVLSWIPMVEEMLSSYELCRSEAVGVESTRCTGPDMFLFYDDPEVISKGSLQDHIFENVFAGGVEIQYEKV